MGDIFLKFSMKKNCLNVILLQNYREILAVFQKLKAEFWIDLVSCSCACAYRTHAWWGLMHAWFATIWDPGRTRTWRPRARCLCSTLPCRLAAARRACNGIGTPRHGRTQHTRADTTSSATHSTPGRGMCPAPARGWIRAVQHATPRQAQHQSIHTSYKSAVLVSYQKLCYVEAHMLRNSQPVKHTDYIMQCHLSLITLMILIH